VPDASKLIATETERKGHIRRPVRLNVVVHEALLSSNVRPVTPPLTVGPGEPRRSEAKRAERPIGSGPAADRRDRDEPSSRGVLDRPGRGAARDFAFPFPLCFRIIRRVLYAFIRVVQLLNLRVDDKALKSRLRGPRNDLGTSGSRIDCLLECMFIQCDCKCGFIE